MTSQTTTPISRQHYAGIFLLSLATLLLELALTRVLSVALWYHFGFLIISTALLGFGAAGVTLSLWRKLREDSPLDRALTWLSLAFGLVTLGSFWIMQQVPFDPFSLLSDRKQLLYMPVYYLAIAAPFYCSGLAIGLLLTRGGRAVNRLYALDLFGAGVGCAAIVLVMPTFGGSGSVITAAALGIFSAAIFGWSEVRQLAMVGLVLGMAVGVSAFYGEQVMPITVTANKGGPVLRQQKAVLPVYSGWNTFSKIDVYDRKDHRRIVIDAGTAATSIPDLRGGLDQFTGQMRKELSQGITSTSAAAYLNKPKPNVLVIGSGGGRQVLEALTYGASSVTAVEINPIINRLVAEEMKDYAGGLFDHPSVKLITEEGRSFTKRSSEKYDAIVAVHTISNAAVSSGALSLAENYVLTREAFEDYLDHLSADGVIFFTRPEVQIPRLFTTATEVLRARGITNPGKHLYAYQDHDPRTKGEKYAFAAGFFLKKSPFTPEEIARMEKMIRIGQPTPDASTDLPPVTLYSPVQSQGPSIYQQIVNSRDLPGLYRRQTAQIAPSTDDKPFFNQHARWSSLGWSTFRDIFTQNERGRLALEDKPVAEITLVIILLQSVMIAAVLILLPLFRFSRRGLRVPGRWRYLGYFAGLGLGFIMIEIAFLQRFSLFLGQPVYTYAVILASLLLFTGLGSFLSERLASDPQTALRRIIPAMLAVLIFTALVMLPVFDFALGWSLPARIGVSILLVAPLGVLLGIPFPAGLRLVATEAPALMPWAWGVNGFFTVIGSVGALMLGMAFGFKAVLVLAGLCYLGSLVAVTSRRKGV